jgi:hypothetical protein
MQGGIFGNYGTYIKYGEITGKYDNIPNGYKIYTTPDESTADVFGNIQKNKYIVVDKDNKIVGTGIKTTNENGEDVLNWKEGILNTGKLKNIKNDPELTKEPLLLGKMYTDKPGSTSGYAGELGKQFLPSENVTDEEFSKYNTGTRNTDAP